MYNPQVHYRALFSIEKAPTSQFDHIYKALVGHVRRWLKGHSMIRNESNQVFRSWFYQGGEMVVKNVSWVEVKADEYDFDTRTAPYWVMRFEHVDSNYKHRKWRTDISIHSHNATHADFSITVSWFLERDYLGEQPPVPASSVPRFIEKILGDETLICSIGNKRIKSISKCLATGDGRELIQFIKSPDRIVPVILMNFQFLGDMISPDDLQKKILGSGIVYWYDNAIVHDELIYEWDANAERYRCGPDAIRIYLPNVNVEYWADSRKHRFFFLSDFERKTDLLMDFICQSVFRASSRNIHEHVITNLEELFIYQQKKKLSKLRIAAAASSRSQEELDYIAALEDENTQSIHKVKELENLLGEKEEEIVCRELELEDSGRQLATLQEQFEEFSKIEAHYKQTIMEHKDILKPFNKLPKNLVEVLRLCAELFPHSLVVLEAAYESAEDAKFQFIHEAYDLLFNMGSSLYDLLFLHNSGDIEKEFKQTGYDLTMKESSSTNADRKLMDLRKRTYDGAEHYFNPHTKLNKGGKELRVHFIPDHHKKLIVIGHCGDHLKTAGTTRRKEA